jgi:hypothetical protein
MGLTAALEPVLFQISHRKRIVSRVLTVCVTNKCSAIPSALALGQSDRLRGLVVDLPLRSCLMFQLEADEYGLCGTRGDREKRNEKKMEK